MITTKKEKMDGFTLIEALVYSALVVLVVSAITATTIWTLKAGTSIKNTNEILSNAQQAINTIVYETRKASSVYQPTSIFSSSPGQLSLIQETNNIPEETQTYLDFFICEQALCLKREASEPVKITNNKVIVSSLSFSLLGSSNKNPSVQINLALQPSNQTASKTSDFQTSATLRSY